MWQALYKKVISGRPYWYLREMAWVDGKPKMVSERYRGSATDIAAALDARETAIRPERTRHLAFGDVAAAREMLDRLGVVALIDEVVGPRRRDAGASMGTYLALAALGRLVDPRAKRHGTPRWPRRCTPTPPPPPPLGSPAADDLTADDGGVRRRAELAGQPRAPDRDLSRVRRLDTALGLP